MKSYVLDKLVKYHCFDCNKEFILSGYQKQQATKEIICPYCHEKDVEAYVVTGIIKRRDFGKQKRIKASI